MSESTRSFSSLPAAARPTDEPAGTFWDLWRQNPPPNVRRFLLELGEVEPRLLVQVLQIDQQESWRAGIPAPIDNYLLWFPEVRSEPTLTADLIYREYLLRRDLGHSVSLDQYLELFPTYASFVHDLEAQTKSPTPGPGVSAATTIPDRPNTDPPKHDPNHPKHWPVVPGYRILSFIDEGGMGVVYKAEQLNAGPRPVAIRNVALKVMRRDRVGNEYAVKRFLQEITAAACVPTHPNIVSVYAPGEHDSVYFYTMEYVEGLDLARLLARDHPLDYRDVCQYMRQAAEGLHHAHKKGVVHRDIKPHNLMITPDPARVQAGESTEGPAVKILDMGLARCNDPEHPAAVRGDGRFLGTPDYVSPEQAERPQDADIRSDLYSLGCTFYQLLTGALPFPGGSLYAKMERHRLEEPIPIHQLRDDVPQGIVGVVARLMAKDPNDRFQKPRELIAALDRCFERRKPAPNPWGAVREELLCLEGHRDAVSSIALSADDRLVVSSSHDGSVRLWELATGEERAVLEVDGGPALTVAFSHRTGLVAAGYRNGALYLWNPRTGARRLLDGHQASVHSVAFSPCGGYLLSGGGEVGNSTSDHTIRVWDVEGARQIHCFAGHKDAVTAVAFLRDGRHMLSASQDGTVCWWSLDDCRMLGRLSNLTGGPIRDLAVDPHGRRAVCCADRVWVWPILKNDARELTGPGLREGATAVTFSADGAHVLFAGMDETIRLYALGERKEVGCFRGHTGTVLRVTATRDGQRAASCGTDGTIRVWSLPRKKSSGDTFSGDLNPKDLGGDGVDVEPLSAARFVGHSDTVNGLAFSPDGQTVATAADDRTVRLWHVDSGVQRCCFEGHQAPVLSVAFAPDGQRLVSAGADRTIRFWCVGRDHGIDLIDDCPAQVQSVAFSPDGQRLLSGGSDGLLRLWDATTGDEVLKLGDPGAVLRQVAFSPDGRWALSGSQHGHLLLWDLKAPKQPPQRFGDWVRLLGKRVLRSTPRPAVRAIAFSSCGLHTLSGDAEGGVHLWKVADRSYLRSFRGHKGRVERVAFSPDGKRVASCGQDWTVRVWDAATGKELKVYDQQSPVRCLAISPDGRRILSAGASRNVHLWDMPE